MRHPAMAVLISLLVSALPFALSRLPLMLIAYYFGTPAPAIMMRQPIIAIWQLIGSSLLFSIAVPVVLVCAARRMMVQHAVPA